MSQDKNTRIAIIGLGYVGLPLLSEFSKKFNAVGFDIDSSRIKDLKKLNDKTHEVARNDLKRLKNRVSSDPSTLENQDFYIVTVPTPITQNKKPDIKALKAACNLIGKYIRKGNYVIFESTVYPGLTEEICVPIIEQVSSLLINKDFAVGYSPERINPGDSKRGLVDIIKITSASNLNALSQIDGLYKSIIKAGTFPVNSIKVAEAAKVIENTQRDINIALMNELSMLFKKMDIDFNEVLRAANTKWNFLDFQPGLVGGHCIGVDPYYLTFKAEQEGFDAKMIIAGRATNEMMPRQIFKNIKSALKENNKILDKSDGLILGATFKENCPDFRNSKVDDLIKLFQPKVKSLSVYDPYYTKDLKIFSNKKNLFKTLTQVLKKKYDFIIIAVPHKAFKNIGYKSIQNILKTKSTLYDLKSLFSADKSDLRL
tara:strand:- start:6178 stop:7461 length:1284 start_codon:yes stop_codon:yes gene_type:complete